MSERHSEPSKFKENVIQLAVGSVERREERGREGWRKGERDRETETPVPRDPMPCSVGKCTHTCAYA